MTTDRRPDTKQAITHAVIEVETGAIGVRLGEQFLAERRARNEEIWHSPSSWVLGIYYGVGDTRLWVPKKGSNSESSQRAINFAHPLGRPALRMLVFCYTVGIVAAAIIAEQLLERLR